MDLIDVSSGGNYSKQKIDIGPSYQVPYAAELKADKDLKDFPISSVGYVKDFSSYVFADVVEQSDH